MIARLSRALAWARSRPPWRSLQGRLLLSALAGLLVAALVFAALGAGMIRSRTQAVARSELDRQARALALRLGSEGYDALTRGTSLEMPSVEVLEALIGARTTLYYSGLDLGPDVTARFRPPAPPPEVATRLNYRVLERDGVQRLQIEDRSSGAAVEKDASAAPVYYGNEVQGVLLVARPPSVFASAWPDITPGVVTASGIGLAVALVLALFLTSRITRPLRDLRAATHRVAGGDLDTALGPTGVHDLDDVAADFNLMVRDLARRDATARDFLMRITHDLRTPLTAIRGHSAALADGVVPEEDVARSLAAIEGEAERLETLVADLLDLARLDADHFKLDLGWIQPSEVLERAFEAMEAQAAAREVSYERQIQDLTPVISDERRVRQIVGNLLENALNWTPRGGSVLLEAGPRALGGIAVAVSDTGPGVPTERREEIFEPFRSAETPDGRRGTGLGLAISRQLARALGGDIWVEGHEGGGSRFVLELPAEVDPSPSGHHAVARPRA